MNEWQQSFLRKLETAKKQWLKQFEQVLDERLATVVERFEAFLSGNGFRVTSPKCAAGTRIYRFGLSENGYALFTFRLRGLDELEMCCEPFVPGTGNATPSTTSVGLCDASDKWFEGALQAGLDSFLNAFVEAGSGAELQPA